MCQGDLSERVRLKVSVTPPKVERGCPQPQRVRIEETKEFRLFPSLRDCCGWGQPRSCPTFLIAPCPNCSFAPAVLRKRVNCSTILRATIPERVRPWNASGLPGASLPRKARRHNSVPCRLKAQVNCMVAEMVIPPYEWEQVGRAVPCAPFLGRIVKAARKGLRALPSVTERCPK